MLRFRAAGPSRYSSPIASSLRVTVHGRRLRAWSLGFRMQGAGCRVWGVVLRVVGCRVQGLVFRDAGCRAQGVGCRVAGCRVQSVGFMV